MFRFRAIQDYKLNLRASIFNKDNKFFVYCEFVLSGLPDNIFELKLTLNRLYREK